MPDFERLALFKRRTNDGEAVWVATELEKAWLHGCSQPHVWLLDGSTAVMPPAEPKRLKKGTGKITAMERKSTK
jgi:hypothetical protein